jgi:hypothetical protein
MNRLNKEDTNNVLRRKAGRNVLRNNPDIMLMDTAYEINKEFDRLKALQK